MKFSPYLNEQRCEHRTTIPETWPDEQKSLDGRCSRPWVKEFLNKKLCQQHFDAAVSGEQK